MKSRPRERTEPRLSDYVNDHAAIGNDEYGKSGEKLDSDAGTCALYYCYVMLIAAVESDVIPGT